MARRAETIDLVVGVTGLDAGANPLPGAAVAASLRSDPDFRGRIIGLTYDPMTNAAFHCDLFDDVALVPWPGDDEGAWVRALLRLRTEFGLDVVLPCLDSDVPTLARIAADLRRGGLGLAVPTEAAVKARFKWNLPDLCARAGVATPRTAVLYDVQQIHPLAGWTYPVLIKGSLADCMVAQDATEAEVLFHEMAARWGYPVLVQPRLAGVEYLLSGLCVEPGRPASWLAIKKVRVTADGKATAAVTVSRPDLEDAGRRLLETLGWVGPFELEFLLDASSDVFHLIEVNGRFPAWISFAGHAGFHVVTDAVRMAAGRPLPSRLPVAPGLHFVRALRAHCGRIVDAAPLRALAAAESRLDVSWTPASDPRPC